MPALDTASGAHDSPIASSDDESPFTVFSFRPQRRPRSANNGRVAAVVIGLSCVALAATVSIRSLRRQTRVPEYLAATHTRSPSRQPTHRPTVGDATCGMKANQQPIDCDKWDQGSCGNACCVLDVHVDGAVDDAYDALAAYLEGGGGDGLYAKAPTSDTVGHVSEDDQGDYPFQFSPALPWRYTTSGFHATSGGYVDQLKFSVGVTSGGNAKARRPRSIRTPSARRYVGSMASPRAGPDVVDQRHQRSFGRHGPELQEPRVPRSRPGLGPAHRGLRLRAPVTRCLRYLV